MKTKIAGLLYFILAGLIVSVYSQESIISFNKSAELRCNNSLSDLPFRIGLEFGPAIPLKEKKHFYNGWWIIGHVNLYNKRIFLRAAIGNLNTNNEIGNTAPYFSLGFTGMPLVINQHSISINAGLCLFTPNDNTAIMAFSAGVNYLYRFNRYVSLSAGIQMPVIRKSHYDAYYHNPFATIGVVFF